MIEKMADRTYSASEVTFEQDLEYLMNKSIYRYSFIESKNNSLIVTESKNQRIQEYVKTNQSNKRIVAVAMAVVLFPGIFILEFFDLTNSTVPVVIALALTFAAGLMAQFFVSKPEDVFTLHINNSNCRLYQLRAMSDNKWCIICGANFNHENKLIDNAFIAEVKPTFSDLIIMEDVNHIEETQEGLIIRSNATIRRYEPDKPYNKYTEMDGRLLMDIVIWKGIYPENMLEEIAE